MVAPKPLDGPAADHPLDRRIPLADWLTAKDNASSPGASPTATSATCSAAGWSSRSMTCARRTRRRNPPLLDALAKHFADSGFDLKQLMRAIMTSRLYQLDSQPTAANAADSKFYSHFQVKRLPAEALIDAIDRVTGMQTKYRNLPLGTRAIELPDAEYPDYFLNTFAKPRRVSVCECERLPDPSLAQALHTLNGDVLALKIRDAKSRVLALVAAEKPHDEIVDELYLAALSRLPTDAELPGQPRAAWPKRQPRGVLSGLALGAGELEAVFVCALRHLRMMTSCLHPLCMHCASGIDLAVIWCAVQSPCPNRLSDADEPEAGGGAGGDRRRR